MLDEEIRKMNVMCGKETLKNPLKKFSLKKNLIKYYWNGKYFKDALHDQRITGHSNIYPYWLGIIEDKRMLNSSIKHIHSAVLERPIPLKYEHKPLAVKKEFIWQEIFVKGWEHDTVWSMLGMAYIDVLLKYDKKMAGYGMKSYKKAIEDNKAFVEVYTKDCVPYRSLFYTADTSMLWACMYLDLKKRLK